jgi:hypothetical protein
VLGIAAVGALAGPAAGPPTVRQWTQPDFEIAADGPVPAGIDGEAAMLEPPLRFHSVPASLRVRIAPAHPGASPSALIPDTTGATLRGLLRLAFGPRDAATR